MKAGLVSQGGCTVCGSVLHGSDRVYRDGWPLHRSCADREKARRRVARLRARGFAVGGGQ